MLARILTVVTISAITLVINGSGGQAQGADLRPFVRGDFAAILAANAGRPAVVNFWSITCPPCLAEMPALKAFAEQNPSVRLELVSTDSFEDEARIQRTLERQGLGEQGSWVFAEAHKTRLRFDIDKSWRGELPRTYFVGRDGQVHGHSGMVDAAYLNTWLGKQ